MGGEPVDWKDSLIFLPYGDCFRWHRKNFHDHHIIGSRTTVDAYSEIEEVATRQFLKCVLAKPDEPQEHIRHVVGAVILRISYGYEVKETMIPSFALQIASY
ncbi:hypothetical protein EDB19DRAFT_1216939 [Suillus lakei]|nr:hypothetical protein EDB19DRAFT_1216939 [Suillus lakei]